MAYIDREIAGIPVLMAADTKRGSGVPVIVAHGMSTTAEMMRDGWPAVDNRLLPLYWRLPVLREGREAVQARRQRDLFRELFLPVVEESRRELDVLVSALRGDQARPIGLMGFSIGGLIALTGAADHPEEVGAVVAIGGVAHLEYLQSYFPQYDWEAADVRVARRRVDLTARTGDLSGVATLILHGDLDDQARWEWMGPFAKSLAALERGQRGPLHQVTRFPHVRHRLTSPDASPDEARDLAELRRLAHAFLERHLAPVLGDA